jgi:hypothetical protein
MNSTPRAVDIIVILFFSSFIVSVFIISSARREEENGAAGLVGVNNGNINNDQQHQYHRLLTKSILSQIFSSKSDDTIHLETVQYKLPPTIEHNLLDWYDYDADDAGGGNALPVFWHILKSGGTSIKLMYAQCYHLVEACEVGAALIDTTNPYMEAEQLQQQQQQESSQIIETETASELSPWEWMQQQLVQTAETQQQQQHQQQEQNENGDNNDNNNDVRRRGLIEEQQHLQQEEEQNQLRIVMSEDGRKYINVDVTTIEGIQLASQRGFATSTLPNVMFTPLLLDTSNYLLSPQRKGRMFAIFRHPISRVTSIFYYLQSATWEPTYNPAYAGMTIDDYASSPYCESNWMVRSIRNKMTGPLTVDDYHIAKEILHQKCIIGLLDYMEESVIRFHSYFKFNTPYEDALNCAIRNFAIKESGGGGGSSSSKGKQNAGRTNHPLLDTNSATYKLLEQKNMLDIRLYEYAKELFIEQGEWMKAKNMI